MTEQSVPRLTPEREAEIRAIDNEAARLVEHLIDNPTIPNVEQASLGLMRFSVAASELFAELDALRADVAAANARAAQAERERDAALEYGAQVRKAFTGEDTTRDQVLAYVKRMIELEDTVGSVSQYAPMVDMPPVYLPPATASAWTPKPGDRVRVKATGETGRVKAWRRGVVVIETDGDLETEPDEYDYFASELEPADDTPA